MGRWEDGNYVEGYEGDYYIVTDAIDEAFEPLIVEDDIAEPAIYAQTIEKVGKFIQAVVAAVKKGIDVTTHCPLCWQHDGRHNPECPMMIVWQMLGEDEDDLMDEATLVKLYGEASKPASGA